MHQLRTSRQTHVGDLSLDAFGLRGLDVGLDGQRAIRDILAELSEVGDIVGVHGQLVDGHIVACVFGVRPAQHGVRGGIHNILGVGTSEV